MTTFAEIVLFARKLAGPGGMTEAEFDYSIATDLVGANSGPIQYA